MAETEKRELQKALPPGLHHDVPMDVYLSMDACGSSDLNNMMRSPAYCGYQRERYSPSGAAQMWGTALHARLLEPHNFDEIVGVLPEGLNLRTKDGRKQRDDLMDEYDVVLSKDDFAALEAAEASVLSNPNAAALFKADGPTEVTAVAIDPVTGCPMKVRPDKLIPSQGIVLDLKTTRASSHRQFAKQAWDLGYHRKMGYYLHVMNMLREHGPAETYGYGVVVAVCNTPPHEVSVMAVGGESLEIGAESWLPQLGRFAECRETDTWPGFEEEILTLEIPAWAARIEREDAPVEN